MSSCVKEAQQRPAVERLRRGWRRKDKQRVQASKDREHRRRESSADEGIRPIKHKKGRKPIKNDIYWHGRTKKTCG
jgi:hypothetical protein